jgi:hypothetical protein
MVCVRDAGVRPFLAALSPIGVVMGRRSRREFAYELNWLGLQGALPPYIPGFHNRFGKATCRVLSSLAIASVAQLFRPSVTYAENQQATVIALGAAFLTPSKVIFDAYGVLPEEAGLDGHARGLAAAQTATSVEIARILER